MTTIETAPVPGSSVRAASEADLHAFLAEELLAPLRRELERAGPEKRLRVMDLPRPVMVRLCRALQGDPRWLVRVLVAQTPDDPATEATATKIIELRNSCPEPLLVFIPADLRTAAEDSLDIATFKELATGELVPSLPDALLARFPETLRGTLELGLSFFREQGVARHADDEVRYLLTVTGSGATAEAAGAALFVLGLIPDFAAFTRPISQLRIWLSRNERVRRELADAQRPLQERIAALPIEPETIQRDLFVFLRSRRPEDASAWGAEIAREPQYRHLSLERWPFVDEGRGGEVRVILDPLKLPVQKEDKVAGAAPMPVFQLDGKEPLVVSFRLVPPGSQVDALKHVRVQVLTTREGKGEVLWESRNYPKPEGKNSGRMTRKIKPVELEATVPEGVCWLRVEAFDRSGALITTRRLLDPNDPQGRAENESERFLVVREGVDVEPEPPRAVYVGSFLDAWLAASARLLGEGGGGDEALDRTRVRGVWHEPVAASVRGDAHFAFETPGLAGFTVVVPGLLRRVELDILEKPDRLGHFRIELAPGQTAANAQVKMVDAEPLGRGPVVQAFIEARRAAFRAILDQPASRSEKREDSEVASLRVGTVETSDLLSIAGEIERYAAAFIALADAVLGDAEDARSAASARRALARLDAVEARWRRSGSDPGRAILLSPTHPLRLLWHLQLARIGDRTLDVWRNRSESAANAASWRALIDRIRREIVPLNQPAILFDSRGRGYVENAPLTSHWPLFLPDRTEGGSRIDPGACRTALRDAMGIRGRDHAAAAIGSGDVARRIIEFLEQHPYVEKLIINAFHPGDGQLLADTLRAVERMRLELPNPPPLRYAVQMFASGEHVEDLGLELDALLDPDRQVGEGDEFTITSEHHLFPKLLFSRNTVEEFQRAPERFAAHITVLFEPFRVEARLGDVGRFRRGSFVAGLVAEPEVRAEPDSLTAWRKGVRPEGSRSPAPGEMDLVESLKRVQRLQAALAAGRVTSPDDAPILALGLTFGDQALIRQAHEVSDWVLTIDRNVGLDYFDGANATRETGYLLDFSPEFLQEDRPRLLLTTRSSAELAALIRPGLRAFDLEISEAQAEVVLETLRSLSGRFALRLISAPNQSAEVVGLLLARWVLEQAGLLEERVVVPIDAHRAWFADASVGGEASGRRADLLLIGIDEPTETIEISVVEVKVRQQLTDAARAQLYQSMREQADNTEERLRALFDLELFPRPRADRLLQAKELATLLAFYLGRAMRYGLMASAVAERTLQFVSQLDRGYQLRFRTLGVVFEPTAAGAHVEEDEPGFPVHRFGAERAAELLAEAVSLHQRRLERRGSDRGAAPSPPAQPATAVQLKSDPLLDSVRTTLGLSPAPRDVAAGPAPAGGERKPESAKAPGPDEGKSPKPVSHPLAAPGGRRDSPEPVAHFTVQRDGDRLSVGLTGEPETFRTYAAAEVRASPYAVARQWGKEIGLAERFPLTWGGKVGGIGNRLKAILDAPATAESGRTKRKIDYRALAVGETYISRPLRGSRYRFTVTRAGTTRDALGIIEHVDSGERLGTACILNAATGLAGDDARKRAPQDGDDRLAAPSISAPLFFQIPQQEPPEGGGPAGTATPPPPQGPGDKPRPTRPPDASGGSASAGPSPTGVAPPTSTPPAVAPGGPSAAGGPRPGATLSQPPVSPAPVQAPTATPAPVVSRPTIVLGANQPTPQYGVLGSFGNARIAIDLTGCNTVSLFGVQGFGKSYTLGVIAEMAVQPIPGVNELSAPLATVIFHYHKSDAYEPEFASAISPNDKPREVQKLRDEYGAAPCGLRDMLLLTPEAKLEQRRAEFPSIDVRPIKFSSAELGVEGWKFLLGASGNDALYMRQLVAIMRRYRSGLTLEQLRSDVAEADLGTAARRLAEDRIALAAPYIDDRANLKELLRPGRTVIIDLRDEWIEKEEALGLFVALMRIFATVKHEGRDFNKLMVFDEAHKYITESDLIGQVVETIREMRHQATSVVIASQDPLSVPRSVIELTSVLMMHRMTSPQWIKHLKSAISALEGITEGHVAALQPGEVLVWAQRSTDSRFTQRPQKVQIRPRATRHGGGTKTAVSGASIR